MAAETGAVEAGVAIDEDTALIVQGDRHTVSGAGQVWWVARTSDGTSLRVERSRTPGP
jgi:cyanophycinase-like exopeptidase